MIWLCDNNLKCNDTIKFYQVFVDNNIVYNDGDDENTIYSFETQKSIILNEYEHKNIVCDVKIIDDIISYNIISDDNKKNYVFTNKLQFIKPNNNKFNVPLFNYTYKLISPKKLPNLIASSHDFISTINFDIYELDKNNKIQFIIEKNISTNLIRKYFITSDLNLIQQYFDIIKNS